MRPNWNSGQVTRWGRDESNRARGNIWWNALIPDKNVAPHVLNTAIAGRSIATNTIFYVPIWVPATTRFVEITGYWFAVAGGRARMGIYDSNGVYGSPGNRLLDSGEVTFDVAGDKTVSIDITLQPGWYWLCSVQNGTSNMQGWSQTGTMFAHYTTTPGAGAQYVTMTQAFTYGALPATASAEVGTNNVMPMIVLKVAA